MKKLLFIPAFCLLASQAMMAQTDKKVYDIGDFVEDFTLKNYDGKAVSLSDFQGSEGVIIIFTCNTCPWAELYEDRIIGIHQKYVEQGYHVLAINPNDPDIKPGDSFEAMGQRAGEKKFPFHYLMDEKQSLFPLFGAKRTPEVFLLDHAWKLRYTGAIDDNPQEPEKVKKRYLEEAIEALQNGENPPLPRTKAIGCSIKIKS